MVSVNMTLKKKGKKTKVNRLLASAWYFFCLASGLDFPLMEFPWLFFFNPTRRLTFSFNIFPLPF